MRLMKLGIISVILLSGCSLNPMANIAEKEREVKEYNSLVEETFNSAYNVRLFSESEKESLLKYVTEDNKWGYAKGKQLKPLTKKEKASFQSYGIVYDKYFTSLGADGLREVFVINGVRTRMFVTIIWGIEKVHSIDRKVVEV